jgi:hypothetical protein
MWTDTYCREHDYGELAVIMIDLLDMKALFSLGSSQNLPSGLIG